VLIWLLVGALASGVVLRASWWRNRRSWRAEQARSRRWLLAHDIDPGSAPADPPAWKLVLTPDLSATGRFARDVEIRPARTRQPEPGLPSRPRRGRG
jgi:hypothetical protein